MNLAQSTYTNDYDVFVSHCMEQPAVLFRTRFSRCCGLLYFVACRVLGTEQGAEDVVQNCWITASCNPPYFETEGAFRSWLVRILFDEALAARNRAAHERRDLNRSDSALAERDLPEIVRANVSRDERLGEGWV